MPIAEPFWTLSVLLVGGVVGGLLRVYLPEKGKRLARQEYVDKIAEEMAKIAERAEAIKQQISNDH